MFSAFNIFSNHWYGNIVLMGMATVGFPPLAILMIYLCYRDAMKD